MTTQRLSLFSMKRFKHTFTPPANIHTPSPQVLVREVAETDNTATRRPALCAQTRQGSCPTPDSTSVLCFRVLGSSFSCFEVSGSRAYPTRDSGLSFVIHDLRLGLGFRGLGFRGFDTPEGLGFRGVDS